MKFVLSALAAAGLWGSAQAAITPDEAKKLGTTLTTFGAEMAGNKEGTIPPYTGGVTKLPPGFVMGKKRPNPFEGEKPLFSITAQNMDQYADKLSEGNKALFKKFPDYRMDVYPTHRSAAYPKWIQENQVKNATRCKTVNEGLTVEGCYGGTPFPIPKDGYEAMWNHVLRYGGHVYRGGYESVYVDSSGKFVVVGIEQAHQEFPYYDPNKTSTDVSWSLRNEMHGPARVAGESGILKDPIDWVKGERKVWMYMPGQRRVRLAPDLAYDTPIPSRGGSETIDDAQMFTGKMDRYDFKLIGKKEMYIPYNNYRLLFDATNEELFKPNFPSADWTRWELHRVWVIEAKLKAGKRHIYHRRVFYQDEDSLAIMLSDQYDAAGKLYRIGASYCAPRYEVPAPMCGDIFGHIDLVNGVYVILGRGGPKGWVWDAKPLTEREWSPDSLAGQGLR